MSKGGAGLVVIIFIVVLLFIIIEQMPQIAYNANMTAPNNTSVYYNQSVAAQGIGGALVNISSYVWVAFAFLAIIGILGGAVMLVGKGGKGI